MQSTLAKTGWSSQQTPRPACGRASARCGHGPAECGHNLPECGQVCTSMDSRVTDRRVHGIAQKEEHTSCSKLVGLPKPSDEPCCAGKPKQYIQQSTDSANPKRLNSILHPCMHPIAHPSTLAKKEINVSRPAPPSTSTSKH
eukprot:357292-Chlamydomonas_euryale.AAC.1